MAISGVHSLNRRRFILLSIATGVGTIFSPCLIHDALTRIDSDLTYNGPLIAKLNDLASRLGRHEITPKYFVNELHKYYNEIDLAAEFNTWINEVPETGGARPLYRGIHGSGKSTLQLFYIRPNSSHPPHAHHNLVSVQCPLKGRIHVRQYDRVKRVDPDTLVLRPTNDAILPQYKSILTTEYLNNVHWFGAADGPAVVLNVNVKGILDNTFDIDGRRKHGRYYVDPTSADRIGDLIAAPEISASEAKAKFGKRPLLDFASSID